MPEQNISRFERHLLRQQVDFRTLTTIMGWIGKSYQMDNNIIAATDDRLTMDRLYPDLGADERKAFYEAKKDLMGAWEVFAGVVMEGIK